MDTITLTLDPGEDRRVVIDLPPDMPTGPLEITIRPAEEPKKPLTREEAIRRLRAAGKLTTYFGFPEAVERVSDEEIHRIGRLKPGARPSEEIIAEGRGRT